MSHADRRVLIVEDDRDLASTMAEVLEDEGYQVAVAFNGKEALELLDCGQKAPCVILLDLMMPVMDGAEFLGRLMQRPSAKIPIVVCTADGRAHEKAEAAQAAAHLRKPASIDELLAAVEAVCS